MKRDKSSDLTNIDHRLPCKRKGKRVPEPGVHSSECIKRYLEYVYEDGEVSSWVWPDKKPTKDEVNLLMAAMLEISIVFFFDNFMYTFGA